MEEKKYLLIWCLPHSVPPCPHSAFRSPAPWQSLGEFQSLGPSLTIEPFKSLGPSQSLYPAIYSLVLWECLSLQGCRALQDSWALPVSWTLIVPGPPRVPGLPRVPGPQQVWGPPCVAAARPCSGRTEECRRGGGSAAESCSGAAGQEVGRFPARRIFPFKERLTPASRNNSLQEGNVSMWEGYISDRKDTLSSSSAFNDLWWFKNGFLVAPVLTLHVEPLGGSEQICVWFYNWRPPTFSNNSIFGHQLI